MICVSPCLVGAQWLALSFADERVHPAKDCLSSKGFVFVFCLVFMGPNVHRNLKRFIRDGGSGGRRGVMENSRAAK